MINFHDLTFDDRFFAETRRKTTPVIKRLILEIS